MMMLANVLSDDDWKALTRLLVAVITALTGGGLIYARQAVKELKPKNGGDQTTSALDDLKTGQSSIIAQNEKIISTQVSHGAMLEDHGQRIEKLELGKAQPNNGGI